jgi:hypothetical protein
MEEAAPVVMDKEEINEFERRLQTAFPQFDLHIIIDVDGRAEVWSGERALNVKWVSVDPNQIVGLPLSLNPRNLRDILYDMIHSEIQKLLKGDQSDEGSS